MKLKYVNRDKIPNAKPGGRKPGGIMEIVYEFISSGEDAALVDWKENYKDIKSASNNIRSKISRIKAPISVCCRGEELFLLRKGGKRDA